MLLKELQIGDIFAIEGSKSYPKLKIKDGYVDIRDEIVNKTGNCDNREVDLITAEDIKPAMEKGTGYKYPIGFIDEMILDVKAKFIA